MIYNRNGDDSEEDHETDDYPSTNSSIALNSSENKSNANDIEPPQHKRTCNRMSVFGQSK